MNLVEAIFVIVGGVAAALTVIGTFARWVYRCGQASGITKASWEADHQAHAEVAKEVRELEDKVRMLETQRVAMQAELESIRPKRRRA